MKQEIHIQPQIKYIIIIDNIIYMCYNCTMTSGTDDTVDVGVAIILKLFERGWYDDFIRL